MSISFNVSFFTWNAIFILLSKAAEKSVAGSFTLFGPKMGSRKRNPNRFGSWNRKPNDFRLPATPPPPIFLAQGHVIRFSICDAMLLKFIISQWIRPGQIQDNVYNKRLNLLVYFQTMIRQRQQYYRSHK